MRKIAKILLYLIIIIPSIKIIAQDEVGSFEFDGHLREYEVYLPQNYEPNMPVVLALHGYTETIQSFKEYTKLHEVADTMGYVIVYPQGVINSWNGGVVDPNDSYPNTDDVGFISALIDTMKIHHDIDLSKVYCCGYSLGGMMGFRLIGDIGYRFAAAASVSGPLFGLANTWEIVRPIPILQMHGTSDILVPYEGNGDYWSITETLDYWLNKNNCSMLADTFNFPDIEPSDNCTIQKISYLDCSGGSQFIHYKGIGMGHSWPGSATTFGSEGNKNMDINANVEILKFFKNFDNPLVSLAYGNFIAVDSSYLNPSNDTLFLNAEIMNPKGHSTLVYAIIKGEETNYRDSIELYDDGMHNDGNEFDNIYCENKYNSSLEEDFYTVKLYTEDLDESITTNYSGLGQFTTAGPVVIDSSVLEPFMGTMNKLKLYLRNEGSTLTVSDITVKLTTLDTNNVNSITTSKSGVDIAAGHTVEVGTVFIVVNGSPDTTLFNLNICSNGYGFWQESFAIDLTPTDIGQDGGNMPKEFALEQNYPNPFNPSTKINYSIPYQNYVTLKVFDVLGRAITTLVNKEQSVGNYEVKFDASHLTSGVYFYKIQAGDYVDTKKMLMLK